VCGLDNAAQNTDAIILFNYNVKTNNASFVQIPRDTYADYSQSVNKINSIYPSARVNGMSHKDSMQRLSDFISDALGVGIDGYIAFTLDSLTRLIDAVGGVDINLPTDINFTDPDGKNQTYLPAGRHHLSGEQAVRFIRYRDGYALGDLGRIDAQKFFLRAFVDKLKTAINIKLIAKSAVKKEGGTVTNIKISDVLGIALKLRSRLKECNVRYANLPGTADKMDDGHWYYFVNRTASEDLLNSLDLARIDGFDKNQRFLSKDNDKTIDFYNNDKTKWRILDDNDILNIEIKEKSA
jgi:LCP family protein required for cell wall assembly